MGLSAEQLRVQQLLIEAIKVLCKSGLTYSKGFSVEGLLGITLLDSEDVFLVSIKETILGSKQQQMGDLPFGDALATLPQTSPFSKAELDCSMSQEVSSTEVGSNDLRLNLPPQKLTIRRQRGGRKRGRGRGAATYTAILHEDMASKDDWNIKQAETAESDANGVKGEPFVQDSLSFSHENEQLGRLNVCDVDPLRNESDSVESNVLCEQTNMEGHADNHESGPVSIKSEPMSEDDNVSSDASSGHWEHPLAFCGPTPDGNVPWSNMPGTSTPIMGNSPASQDPMWMMAVGGSPNMPNMSMSSWAKLREETVKRRHYRHRMKLLNPGKWEETKRREAERKRQIREQWSDEKREAERQKGRERKRAQRQIMKEQAAAEMEVATQFVQNSLIAQNMMSPEPAAPLPLPSPGAPGMFGILPTANPMMAAAMAAATNNLTNQMAATGTNVKQETPSGGGTQQEENEGWQPVVAEVQSVAGGWTEDTPANAKVIAPLPEAEPSQPWAAPTLQSSSDVTK